MNSANKWFDHIKKAKDLITMRDKYRKEYDHYLKKTIKMKSDREAKKARNPTGIETAKDVEWYLRNDRKLETSKNNYITLSQQSYSSAQECIKLRYGYMIPVLDTFSKSVYKFFCAANNSIQGLPRVTDEIAKGKELEKEREAEEKIKQLRVEEEKLRKMQENRERLAKEKVDRERQEQERVKKELEDKQRELQSKYSPSETKGSSSNYNNQDQNPYPGTSEFGSSNYGDGYYDNSGGFRTSPPRPPRPSQDQYSDFYQTSGPSYRPRPSESDSYFEPPRSDSYSNPPKAGGDYYGSSKAQGDYYDQPRPRGEYYNQPRPRGEYYDQPRARGEYYDQPRPRGGYYETKPPGEYYNQEPPRNNYYSQPRPRPDQSYGENNSYRPRPRGPDPYYGQKPPYNQDNGSELLTTI